MVIKIRITFKQYVKLLFTLTYKRPIMLVIVSVGFLMVVWIVNGQFKLLPVPKPTIYQYITLFLISIVQPIVIYTTVRKNYHSSNHLKEPLEIEFTPQQIKIKGQSFNTEFNWENAFKITELKNWFIIYESNLSAIIIPKKSFDKAGEKEFREIVKSLKEVPVHLKS